MTSQIKTVLLLALLSAIIIGLGGIMGGRTGIIIAFVIAMIMNVGSYWYSDKIVLSMYQARELSEDEAPMLHRMVAELSDNAGIPKPRVCVIPEDAPNAFATGRDPEHGVVAVTDGIMRILSPEELRGVIAHEIGHIANRDILIQTIAGVLASVIVSIANFMQFAAIFGGSSNDEEGGTNPIAAFLLAILAPIAASIIQMAISRSREYLADETGARICGQPLALAGALHKLGVASGQIPMQNGNPSTEQMFIVSPLFGFGGGLGRGNQAAHLAGGLFQQIRAHGLLFIHQQHPVAAGFAAACRREQRRPFFHRFALVAGKVHAALLHHAVEGGKAVVPPAGDLDLIRRDGRAVHIQPVAREPGLDVLRTLDLITCRRDSHRAGADVPPQKGAEDHQRTAERTGPHLFQARLVQRYHKHAVPSHPFCSEKNIWGGQRNYNRAAADPLSRAGVI